jgi:hypothetical protein
MQKLLLLVLVSIVVVSGCVKQTEPTALNITLCPIPYLCGEAPFPTDCHTAVISEIARQHDCAIFVDPDTKALCSGLKNKNGEDCKAVSAPRIRDLCFSTLASAANNADFCGEIQQGGTCDQTTRGSCYKTIAESTLNLSLCDFAENRRGECYVFVAEKTRDIGACAQMDVSWAGGSVSECYGVIAKAANNSTICDIINSRFGEADDCYYNFGICDKIQNVRVRNTCYVSKTECDKIEQSVSAEFNCKYKLNIKLCGDYSTPCANSPKVEAAMCIYLNNASNADYNREDMANCYGYQFDVMKDYTICELLLNVSAGRFDHDGCYIEVMQRTSNTTYCGNVIDAEQRDWCYKYPSLD